MCLVGDNQSSLSKPMKVRAGLGLITQQRLLRHVSYLLSIWGILVWLFWVPTHLMLADPVSRHIEDFGCDLNRFEVRARDIFKDAMDHFLEPDVRVNGLVSPEERQANTISSSCLFFLLLLSLPFCSLLRYC